jgi:hypothetical protein
MAAQTMPLARRSLDVPTAPAADQAAVRALSALAANILNEHVNDQARCAICRCPFPCRFAVLAEHTLGGL